MLTSCYDSIKPLCKTSKDFRGQIPPNYSLLAVDLDASQITKLVALNRNSVNRYLCAIRERIAEFCETQSPFSGEIEVDESYFGARRVKGKRGRGASGKTIVFGVLKRHGKVYTEIVPDCSKATLQAVIRGKVTLTVSSIRMGGVVTMGLLMWVMENIFALIMDVMSLLTNRNMLMTLKGFGDSPKLACTGFAV